MKLIRRCEGKRGGSGDAPRIDDRRELPVGWSGARVDMDVARLETYGKDASEKHTSTVSEHITNN